MTVDVFNPMLEDDEEVVETVSNPMLEDDEETTASASRPVTATAAAAPRFAPIRLPQRAVEAPARVEQVTRPTPAVEDNRKRLSGPVGKPENVGKEGFDSLGRRIVKRAPRARATEKDALNLAFIAVSGVTTDEAMSLLQVAKQTGFQKTGGSLVTPGTVARRMWQLSRMGYVHAWQVNNKFVWTITEEGIVAAQAHGYLQDDLATPKDISGLKARSVQHKLSISMAMAHFLSPANLLKDALGLEAVGLDSIIGEAHILRAQEEIEQDVFKRSNAHENVTYGSERARIIREARVRIREGRLSWGSLMEAHPELWTIGQPPTDGAKVLGKHDPDFAVSLETGRGEESRSILVEVELSKKKRPQYEELLRTFQREVIDPVIYERVVYFTNIPSLEATLRDIDESNGFGLFASGRLVVLPLTGRNGSTIRYKQKTIGQPKI